MPPDRIVTALAYLGHCLKKLRQVSGEDDRHELAERVASVLAEKLGPNERRCLFVAALMAAEPIDQQYIGWVLGGAVPAEDSKYPYWQMLLARADDDDENRAVFRRSTAKEAA